MQMEFLKRMGDRLREIRKSMRLTQQEMGEIMGASRASYSLYENGKLPIDVIMLEKLRQKTNYPTDYILGLSDNKYILDEPMSITFSQAEKEPPLREGYTRLVLPASEIYANVADKKINLKSLIQKMIEEEFDNREANK